MRQIGKHQRHAKYSMVAAFVRQHTLQIALWTLWTLVVTGTAVYQWHYGFVRQLPFDTFGMVVRCMLVGILGMVMITNIEIWLDMDVDMDM